MSLRFETSVSDRPAAAAFEGVPPGLAPFASAPAADLPAAGAWLHLDACRLSSFLALETMAIFATPGAGNLRKPSCL